jgi:acetyl esterase
MPSPEISEAPDQSRTGDRRVRVDPRATALLTLLDSIGWPSFSERTPAQARSDYQVLVATTCRWGIVRSRRDAIADRTGYPSVPVRVYWPLRQDKPCPVVVWLHGGGFVIGDMFTADSTCRKLATASRSIVVSVDYRRAPEHLLPAPQHDAVTAVLWAFAHAHQLGGDPRRIVVAGDSAGGALAAHTAQFLRDHTDHRAALQVLVYPATNFTLGNADRSSALAQLLTWDTIEWFAAHSLKNLDCTDPTVSPYFAASCADLPPAYIVTAEVDPFRTDAVAYAERLTAAGVPVTHRDYRGQIHGFVDMDLLFPAGVAAIRGAGHAIRRAEPVAVGGTVSSAAPLRWRSPSATVRRLAHETMVRHPGVNTARLVSTLADQRWRNTLRALELPPINTPNGR